MLSPLYGSGQTSAGDQADGARVRTIANLAIIIHASLLCGGGAGTRWGSCGWRWASSRSRPSPTILDLARCMLTVLRGWCRQVLGVTLPALGIFRERTIANLAVTIRKARVEQKNGVAKLSKGGRQPSFKRVGSKRQPLPPRTSP